MGHPVALDALLTPVPMSEFTLPQLPPGRAIGAERTTWRGPGELHIGTFMLWIYSNVPSRAFGGTRLLATFTHAHKSGPTFRR